MHLAGLLARLRRAKGDGAEEGIAEAGDTPLPEDRLPLHVLTPQATLSVSASRLRVNWPGGERLIRLNELSLVALHGGASVTIPALHLLAEAGRPLLMFSRSGRLLATLRPPGQPTLRRAQDAAAPGSPAALLLARQLIAGRIASTARLAARREGAGAPVVIALRRAAEQARQASSAASLRGIEGAATARYLAAWPDWTAVAAPQFRFVRRSRQPPADGINALLSFASAVVVGQISAALDGVGLDPSMGVMHAARPGRPSLALDLVEPYRTGIIEAPVLTAVNGGRLSATDLEPGPQGGTWLSPSGRRKAIDLLEERLSAGFRWQGTEITWRGALHRAAFGMARAIARGEELDLPLPT